MAGATKLMTAGGGGVSLTPASSIASDVTVNVPSQNCTLDIQGPAFSAYQSANQTSIATSTWTKMQMNTEEYDTANCYDSSTNYRFTPNVAGYYLVIGQVSGADTNNTVTLAAIYKNGSLARYATGVNTPSGGSPIISNEMYMNGTTDYIELYGFQNTGSSKTLYGGQTTSFFQAALVRAA